LRWVFQPCSNVTVRCLAVPARLKRPAGSGSMLDSQVLIVVEGKAIVLQLPPLSMELLGRLKLAQYLSC